MSFLSSGLVTVYTRVIKVVCGTHSNIEILKLKVNVLGTLTFSFCPDLETLGTTCSYLFYFHWIQCHDSNLYDFFAEKKNQWRGHSKLNKYFHRCRISRRMALRDNRLNS